MKKIVFRIHFQTTYGQEMLISGSNYALGGGELESAVNMHYEANGYWSYTLEVSDASIALDYAYILRDEYGILHKEFGVRELSLPNKKVICVEDSWRAPNDINNTFQSSAFTKAIFKPEQSFEVKKKNSSIRLAVRYAKVPKNKTLGILGNIPELGAWDIHKVIKLSNVGFPIWDVKINSKQNAFAIEYKYVLVDSKTGEVDLFEEGENRILYPNNCSDYLIKTDEGARFNFVWRGAGVAIPVFALRTKNSMGVGEFTDLIPFADWSEKTGMNVLQILPVNDTTAHRNWKDSYPYNAISVNALHPQFLNIEMLFDKPGVRLKQQITQAKKELNAINYVDYEKVMDVKMKFAREAFEKSYKTTKSKPQNFLESNDFKKFAEENEFWLLNYAAFSYLRDHFKTSDFTLWGKYAEYSSVKVQKLFQTNEEAKKEMAFYLFLQYHLDKQLKLAVNYVRAKGIVLKGDIPIGVNRYGVEAWAEPHYFDFTKQTGAPPDDFAVDGQNWGFPTYRWNVMEHDGYTWWRNRLVQMSRYFDAYRIDHILGFFRIWQIPTDYKTGLMGHFNPALPFSLDEIRSFGVYIDVEYYTEPTSDENMLFVRGANPGEYHPKISMLSTRAYYQLNDDQKAALAHLFNHYFYHRHNAFWQNEAIKKLSKILAATKMLVCGEDLGMIPACVPYVMDKLQILSLEVQRMPKADNVSFGETSSYPYPSVATCSSHDTSTLRGWWEEDANQSQYYYNSVLWQHGEAPKELTAELAELIVRNHLNAPSILTIIPLQDYLAISNELKYDGDVNDERINVPANPNNYWKYRMHMTVEALLENDSFNEHLARLVKNSGRN